MNGKTQYGLTTGTLLIVMGVSGPVAWAASFDCSQARTPVEKMICADSTLSRLDEELTVAFRGAVANDPQVRQQQSDWRRNTRAKCESVDCLITEYRTRIQALSGPQELQSSSTLQTSVAGSNQAQSEAQGSQRSSTPQASAPASLGANRPGIRIDAKSFIGRSAPFQERYWNDPKNEVFGKRIAEWTDQDFQLLDKKLREQIIIERNVAAEYVRRVGLKSSPDDDSIFQLSRQYLEDAIAAIPQFKQWSGMAREKLRAEVAERQAQEQQRQADEGLKQQKEIQRQAETQRQQLAQESQRQAEVAPRQQEEIQRQAETQRQQIAQESQRQAEVDDRRQQEAIQRQPEIKRQDAEQSRNDNLKIALGVIAAVLGAFGWNKLIRNRCPNCKSTSFDKVGETELSRSRGTKVVTERHSRGTNTRHVATTYVRTRFEYRCRACQHNWEKEKQEEVGATSALRRFISGY